MKLFYKVLTILLVLAFLFSLAACGGSKSTESGETSASEKEQQTESTQSEEQQTESAQGEVSDAIVGTWKYVMYPSEAIKEEMKEEEGFSDDFEMQAYAIVYEGLTTTLFLDFKEDGTFTMFADEDEYQENIEKMKKNIMDHYLDLAPMLYGMTREEFEAQMAEDGLTLEELLEKPEVIADIEYLAEDLVGEGTVETSDGTYTFEDGKLRITIEDTDEQTLIVKFTDNAFEVIEVDGESQPEGSMVFTRCDN